MTDPRRRAHTLLLAAAGVCVIPPASWAADAVWRGQPTQADPDGAGRLGTVAFYAPWRNNANWTPASFPDNGQAATFDAASPSVAYLDGSISLRQINYYNPAGAQIVDQPRATDPSVFNPSDVVPASGAVLTLVGSAVVDVPNYAPLPNTFGPTTNTLAVPIGGSAGLTKTGGGLLFVTAANPYTGGTRILGGRLATAGPANATGAVGDARLGAAGQPVSLDNGADLFVGVNTLTSRTLTVGPGGGNLGVGAGIFFTSAGNIAGAGPLQIFGAARTLAGTNAFGGALTLRGPTTLTGTFASAPVVRASNALALGATTDAGSPNRLGDAATLVSEGIDLSAVAGTNVGFYERVGTLALEGGLTSVQLRNATAAATPFSQLSIGTLSRQNGAGVAFVADGLGAITNGRNVLITNGLSLTRGNGTPVIPWAFANPAAPEILPSLQNPADTFVTYSAATGVTPLPLSGYVGGVRFAGPNDYVRNTAAEYLNPIPYAINGLILTAGASFAQPIALNGPGATVSIASGAVLSADDGTGSAGNTIFPTLAFGPVEAVFQTPAGLNLLGGVTGTGGLSKIGNGRLSLLGAPKTYTGKTYLQGPVAIEGDVLAGVAGPLGADSSAVDLRGSTADADNGAGLAVLTVRYGGRASDPASAAGAGGSTVNRQLLVRGTGGQITNAGTPATDGRPSTGLTLAGGIDVAAGAALFLTRPADQTAAGLNFSASAGALPTTVSAPITGAGSVGYGDSQLVRLNAASTYSGGTTLNVGTLTGENAFAPVFQIGSNAPFGTGTVTVNSPAVIQAAGVARTVPNDFSIAPLAVAPGATPPPSLIVGGGQNLTFTGRLDTAGGATVNAIQVNAGGFTTFSGPVSGPGFFKTGPGTLVLSGQNTFTDRLSVGDVGAGNTGVVDVISNGALGRPSAKVQVLPNNALWIQGVTPTPVSVGGAGQQLLLFGRGVSNLGALYNVSGNNRYNGDTFLLYGNGFNTGRGTVGVAPGTTLSTGPIFSNGSAGPGLEKVGTGALVADRFVLNSLAVTAGTLRVAAGPAARPVDQNGSVSAAVPTFSGGATSALDLQNTTLLVSPGGPNPPTAALNAIRQLLRTSFAGPNGAWTGGGLTTSLGTADRFALGYAAASQVALADQDADGRANDFAGLLGVSPSDVLVSYTLFGDSNLDGAVNFTDFQTFLGGFGKSNAGGGLWTGGDFNYDGVVDAADFRLLLGNFGARLTPGAPNASAAEFALVSAFARGLPPVPEPSLLAPLAAAGLLIRRRRRRIFVD